MLTQFPEWHNLPDSRTSDLLLELVGEDLDIQRSAFEALQLKLLKEGAGREEFYGNPKLLLADNTILQVIPVLAKILEIEQFDWTPKVYALFLLWDIYNFAIIESTITFDPQKAQLIRDTVISYIPIYQKLLSHHEGGIRLYVKRLLRQHRLEDKAMLTLTQLPEWNNLRGSFALEPLLELVDEDLAIQRLGLGALQYMLINEGADRPENYGDPKLLLADNRISQIIPILAKILQIEQFNWVSKSFTLGLLWDIYKFATIESSIAFEPQKAQLIRDAVAAYTPIYQKLLTHNEEEVQRYARRLLQLIKSN